MLNAIEIIDINIKILLILIISNQAFLKRGGGEKKVYFNRMNLYFLIFLEVGGNPENTK